MSNDVIKCKCSYITSVSPDKTFVTGEFVNQDTNKRFKAKGKNTIPPYCAPELAVNITGRWVEYKKDGCAHKIFDVLKFEPLKYESRDSFLGYLQTCFKGVGPKTAAKILYVLGDNYEDFDEKVLIDGYFNKAIGKKLATSIRKQKESYDKQDDLYKIMTAAGISEKKINEFRNDYGKDAMNELRSNPFLLYERYGVPFSSSDAVCLMLSGEDPSLIKSNKRIGTCAKYILKNKIAFQGHTFVSTEVLLKYTLNQLNENKVEELRVTKSEVARVLDEMAKEKEIVCGTIGAASKGNTNSWYAYDSFYFEAENYIATRIAEMVTTSCKHENPEKVMKVIKDCERSAGITLEEKQKEAVVMALNNKFSVITGGPGTGKTTVLKICIDAYKRLNRGNGKIALAAPTGRAAMRMALMTGLEAGASTIHSLLGLTGKENDETLITPNHVDADILFLDESSMCEIGLFYRLLFNTDEYTKIVLIGDPCQLPPVGAGEVLKSIIESGVVPVTRLSVIYRQLETSTIVYNAKKITNGDVDIKTGSDFIYYPYTNTDDIKNSILYAFRKELDEIKDVREVQIITPMREKGELSALSFNKAVQELVNPMKTSVSSSGNTIYPPSFLTSTGLRIRKSDKVVCQKNTDAVMNGDIGIVTEMSSGDNRKAVSAVIKFDGRPEREFTGQEMSDMNLTLGYAITVHKSQGSEFKTVLLPVGRENKAMLRRNLFYTAVTRAKDKFVLAGDSKEVAYSIRNNAQDYRRTCLAACIREKTERMTPKQNKKGGMEYYSTLSALL